MLQRFRSDKITALRKESGHKNPNPNQEKEKEQGNLGRVWGERI